MKHPSKGMHPGFEIQGRRHQKYKHRGISGRKKRMMFSIFFFNKMTYTKKQTFHEVLESLIFLTDIVLQILNDSYHSFNVTGLENK